MLIFDFVLGLLLKLSAVEESMVGAMDNLLIVVLVMAFFAVAYAIVEQIITLLSAIRRARYCGVVLQALPQQDPPNDTNAFYLIQIPVEESNLGEKFTPKLPHLLKDISPEDKLKVVKTLTAENEIRLDAFFDRLKSDWMSPVQLVRTSTEVTEHSKVCLRYSRKTDESILLKARRPVILASNPKFSVEHIRDTYRFKAVVYSFRDALQCVFCMDKDSDLCPTGLTSKSVAKLDIAKLRKPKEWGWRFLAFDFIMPNNQIVEVSAILLNPPL